jgi:hypothetical protein
MQRNVMLIDRKEVGNINAVRNIVALISGS